jgi:hypothetical protein
VLHQEDTESLSVKQEVRKANCSNPLTKLLKEPIFLERTLTGDETQVFQYKQKQTSKSPTETSIVSATKEEV